MKRRSVEISVPQRYLALALLLVQLLLSLALVLALRSVRRAADDIGSAPAADTVWLCRHDTLVLPGPRVVERIAVPVPAVVDTASILASYFARNVYVDTLVSTSTVQVSVVDTVSRNGLLGRTVYCDVRQPQFRPRWQLSAGAVAGSGIAAPQLLLSHGRWGFSAGFDMCHRGAVAGVTYQLASWQ